jgi:cephalosporin hydroxylase
MIKQEIYIQDFNMNIQENITKFTDLEKNDSLSAFRGHTAQQSHNAYQVFYDFISEVQPKRILEIGTALGGFTEFLKQITDALGLETKILSYDIAERPWYNQMIEKGIDVRVENIFNDDWSGVKQEVSDFIKEDGLTIVLCDGGWKIGEFKVLSKLIKEGDFILAHDYSFSKEVYELEIKDKIWNWCEITESDIEQFVIENNLKSYQADKFSQAVWVCKVK